MTEVDQDLLCIGCGYDLRHASRDGVCSECGLAVVKSREGDQLYRADATWLRFVRTGLSCIVIGDLSLLTLIVISLARSGSNTYPRWLEIYALLVCVVFSAMQTVSGWWAMGAEKRELLWPAIARIATVVFALCMVSEVISQVVSLSGSRFGWREHFGDWMDLAWGGMCVQMIAVYVRGRGIARRSWWNGLRWQCDALCVIEVLFLISAIITRNGISSSSVFRMAMLAEMILALLLMSWGAAVVWMMRRCVTRALQFSTSDVGAASAAGPPLR